MTGNYHIDNAFFANPLDYEDLFLIQIGRMYCKNTTVIDTHIHTDLFELTVITDGEGTVTTNGVPVKVKSGEIYLSMPCDIHKIESDRQNPLKYDFFAFQIKDNGFKGEFDRIVEAHHSPDMRLFHDARISRLVANAIGELTAPSLHSEALLNTVFRQIIIYLIRDFQKVPDKNYPDNVTEAEILCYKLMNYIDTHIYTLKNLSELCDATDYSYGYLSALFKRITSETLRDYYNKKRTDAARLLLKENRLSVTEISETLGYSSLYAFSKAFKNRFGLSPRLYRKQLLSENEP